MFEVKYPEISEYDGKVHLIEIAVAYEVNNGNKKDILVYGQENGKIIPLVLRYIDEINEYVYIPCSKMELLNITSPILERKEITEELIEKLRGKRIKNLLDINNKKNISGSKNYESDDMDNNFLVDDSALIIEANKTNEKLFDKAERENNWDDFIDLIKVNKKKALNLLSQFVVNNTGKYHNKNIEIDILKLINNLLNLVQEIPYTIYTEDELIDLGSLLAKLDYNRINILKKEDVQLLINNGYVLCDKLHLIKKKAMGNHI